MAAEAYPHAAAGAGGKYPRRPQPRLAASSPYARPHDPGGSRRWLPKVLDPALNLFSSVMRRAPRQIDPPTPPPQEVSCEQKEVADDTISSNPSMSAECLEGVKDGETKKCTLDADGISKIEDVLKRKTFTRCEYDKLTELLRSRTIDLSHGNLNDQATPNILLPKDRLDQTKDVNPLLRANRMGSSKLLESNLNLGAFLNAPEMEIASPAELAKAYMGSRFSRPSLSSTLESPPASEIVSFTNSQHQSKPIQGSAASRSVIRFSKLLENGHVTPEFQGRFSHHKLTQSSVKGRSSVFNKRSDECITTSPEPFMPQVVSSNGLLLSASKTNLKRRSSVLDIDTGSADLGRRTRQKSSFVTPSKVVKISPFRKPLHTPSPSQLRGSVDYTKKPFLLGSAKYNNTMKEADDRASKPSCSSYVSVPQKSSLMARKILQQLDHLVSSPKENYLEQKNGGTDGSASKPSFSTYLNGTPFGSKDSKSFKTFNVEGKNPCTPMVPLVDAVGNSGHISLRISGSAMASQPISVSEIKFSGVVSDKVIPNYNAASTSAQDTPLLKQAFESPLKLDVNNLGSKATSSILTEKLNHGVSTGEHKPVFSEPLPVEAVISFDSSKKNDEKVTEDTTSFSPVASSQPSYGIHLISSRSTQPDPIKDEFRIPVFSFGSKKAHRLVFSSAVPSSDDSSDMKFGIKSELKLQIPMSISPLDKGAENVGEEPPVFTFGSCSITTHLSNGAIKPNRSVFSFTSKVPSNPASNLLVSDRSTGFGTLSSLKGFDTLKSFSLPASPLFAKSVLSPVQSELKDLNGKPVGVSNSTSLACFPAQAGSIFGSSLSSGAAGLSTTSAPPALSIFAGPGSALLSNVASPTPFLFDSKDLDKKSFGVSSSASSAASFVPEAKNIFGLISPQAGTSLGSTAAQLLGSQALCSTPELSTSAQNCMDRISYTASVPSFSSTPFSFTSSSSNTASTSTTLPSMFGVGQIIPSHPEGDHTNVDEKATDDTVQSCMNPVYSGTGLPSPATSVQLPVFQFGSLPSPALPQNRATFPPSGNSDSAPGGPFSIGSSGGGDKSARRIIKVKRDRPRR